MYLGSACSANPSFESASDANGAAPDAGPIFATPFSVRRDCDYRDVTVLFLMDRSGSMNCNPPPTTTSSDCEEIAKRVDPNEPSKWEIVSSVLSTALDRLVPDTNLLRVRAGLSFFSTDDLCGARSEPTVPIFDSTPQQMEILRRSLSSPSIAPAGRTPLVASTVLAYKHLYQPDTFAGDAHVILITDGADSCQDVYDTHVGPGDHVRTLVEVEAPKALSVGISTWVIGVPGSEPARHMLSTLALAGGTARAGCQPGDGRDPTVGACHYDMTLGDFGSALEKALDQVLATVTCRDPA